MKSFIFTETKNVRHRTLGHSNVTIMVYEIIDNIPREIGEAKFCTASRRGAISEAATVVLNKYPELLKEGDNARHVYYYRYDEIFHLTEV